MDNPRIDDEHNLIARYAAKLATAANEPQTNAYNSPYRRKVAESDCQLSAGESMHEDLINELEASNRHIMEEISQLRQEKEAMYSNSNLLFELQMLKQHKGELESRMGKLQDGRKDLIEQLEQLMTVLKARDRELSSLQLQRTGSGSSLMNSTLFRNLDGASDSGQLTPRSSYPSCSSAPLSRTKKQFGDLFDAADAVNDALSHLVEGVTLEEVSSDALGTTLPES